jgi:hypothetical protein
MVGVSVGAAEAVAAHRLLNRLTIILGTAKALDRRWGDLTSDVAANLASRFADNVEAACADSSSIAAVADTDMKERLDALLDAVGTAAEWPKLAPEDRSMLLKVVEHHAGVAAAELTTVVRGVPLEVYREQYD